MHIQITGHDFNAGHLLRLYNKQVGTCFGSNNGQLFELDLLSLRFKRMDFDGLEGIVNDLEFSADGKTLFVEMWQEAPALLQLRFDSEVVDPEFLEAGVAPRALAISFDGTILYSGYER